ncbi:hypothetical protein ABIA33_006917 [Streptacidiphilus sp. MAP12-16]
MPAPPADTDALVRTHFRTSKPRRKLTGQNARWQDHWAARPTSAGFFGSAAGTRRPVPTRSYREPSVDRRLTLETLSQ